MGAPINLAPAKPLTGLSWVSGLAQGAAAKESPFVAVVLGWLRLHLRYAASEGALDAVGSPYRRVWPFPNPSHPQPQNANPESSWRRIANVSFPSAARCTESGHRLWNVGF